METSDATVARLRSIKARSAMIERERRKQRTVCGRQPGTYITSWYRPWTEAIINSNNETNVLSSESVDYNMSE